jgi:hypothetical protein
MRRSFDRSQLNFQCDIDLHRWLEAEGINKADSLNEALREWLMKNYPRATARPHMDVPRPLDLDPDPVVALPRRTLLRSEVKRLRREHPWPACLPFMKDLEFTDAPSPADVEEQAKMDRAKAKKPPMDPYAHLLE